MNFRKLKAEEIDARIGSINSKGLTLLLYKDARCDMAILDETVGAENWQRSHELINGNLFCNVSIKCGDSWITKQDVGTESYTEKEKGQASDAFKRACVNWGIGRELYTAPLIWFAAADCNIENGKCYDKFCVNDIDYDGSQICKLSITNTKTGKVFKYGYGKDLEEEKPKKSRAKNTTSYATVTKNLGTITVNAEQMGKIKLEMLRTGITEKTLCVNYKISSLNELTEEQVNDCIYRLNQTESKQ